MRQGILILLAGIALWFVFSFEVHFLEVNWWSIPLVCITFILALMHTTIGFIEILYEL